MISFSQKRINEQLSSGSKQYRQLKPEFAKRSSRRFPKHTSYSRLLRHTVNAKASSSVAACWERLLESGEALLGETLLEFRGRDVVEVF